MTDRVLNVLVGKLGINSDRPVVRKAEELRRLVSLKMNASNGLSHLNETCVAVICIDLAARSIGVPFDAASGAKLSCVTKLNYMRALHTVERLLGLSGDLTLKDIAVRAGGPNLTPLAERIFTMYKSDRDKPEDFSHPMYNCAAIKAASRLSKTPVNKDVLAETCCVKMNQLERLSTQMTSAYEAVNPEPATPKAKKRRGRTLAQSVEEAVVKGCDTVTAAKKEDDGLGTVGRGGDDVNEDRDVETIEDWKKRILGS